MDLVLNDAARVAAVGAGATAVMDVWLWLLKRAGVPTMNMAMVGRWLGHLRHGQWAHEAIGKSPAVAGEGPMGWLAHYAIGIAFAFVLAGVYGVRWAYQPSPGAALTVGLGTVLLPWLVIQPAMGAGVASMKTSQPLGNSLKSLVNHAVFGWGLYASAHVVSVFFPA